MTTDQTAAPRPVPTFADRTAALEELRAERVKTGRLEGDLRSQTRAVRELIAERDAARQELGAAGEVLAVVWDAVERIERARAAYDTTPGADPRPRHPGDALADALRNAYTTEHLAGLHERLIEDLGDDSEREDPLGRLIDALFAARHQAPPPPSVPSRRAQEEPTRPTAAQLARLFHDTYEQLAPKYGYETREESAKPWEQVPKANRELMVATCARVLVALFGPATGGVVGEPPARAFVGEPPCSNPGCPCRGTA